MADDWRAHKARLERAFPSMAAAADYAGIAPLTWEAWERQGKHPDEDARERLVRASRRLDEEHRMGAEAIAYAMQLVRALEQTDLTCKQKDILTRSKPIIEKYADLLLCDD